MKAVTCGVGGPEVLKDEDSFPIPELREFDVLVELAAASVNPVDFKVREMPAEKTPRVLGYDGVGIVKKIGSSVKAWKVGDEVMFAGDITRNGTNAAMIAVDSRICGKKPKTLNSASAAALPLVSLTAWELLFENFRLPTDGSGEEFVFMMLNGAGGVGSAAIQLAKHVLGAKTIIATASRPETKEWCLNMGATHVINHHNDLAEELKKIGIKSVDVCFCGVDLDKQFDRIVPIMSLDGRIGSITIGDSSKIDVAKLFFPTRLTLSFEFMFMRPMVGSKVEKQGEILNKVADLVDAGKFLDIANTKLSGLSAETIREAHIKQASGKTIGKIVISY